jgi:RNA recognition motif-containing protein
MNSTHVNTIIPNSFGDALNNSSELTTIAEAIPLVLTFNTSSKKEDKDEIDVMKIVKSVDDTNKYVVPKVSHSKQSIFNKESIDKSTTIRVSNINTLIDEDEFIDLFSKYGDIKRSNLFKEKGYGFISYYEHSSALNALNNMNKFRYNYCILDINWAK